MVYNYYIKCQVCGSIIRIRLQVGYLNQHPIVVSCGKCKTSLCGTVKIDQENIGFKFEFVNADGVTRDEIRKCEYLVECSGEFPVRKQGDEIVDSSALDTPFFSQIQAMDYDMKKIDNYYRLISKLNQTHEKWIYYKRLFDLYINKSPYFEREIKKVVTDSIVSTKTEPEKLHTVHMIEIVAFYEAMMPTVLKSHSFFDEIFRLNPVQMKLLYEFLNAHDGYRLEQMQKQIYKIYDEFIEVYPSLIPAISVQQSGEDSFDFDNKGTTTSTYETIKQFYLDVYETLGNLMIIPVAFNNICYRENFDISDTINSKTYTLELFIRQTKANRFYFCTNNEKYTAFLNLKYNAKLRNAIGHHDVDYDPLSQIITYVPDPKNRSQKETEFLLQFELESLHMFQAIIAVSEYLYRLMELKFIQDGDTILFKEIVNKIGAYDLCPCGSGKKFKFCHKRDLL